MSDVDIARRNSPRGSCTAEEWAVAVDSCGAALEEIGIRESRRWVEAWLSSLGENAVADRQCRLGILMTREDPEGARQFLSCIHEAVDAEHEHWQQPPTLMLEDGLIMARLSPFDRVLYRLPLRTLIETYEQVAAQCP